MRRPSSKNCPFLLEMRRLASILTNEAVVLSEVFEMFREPMDSRPSALRRRIQPVTVAIPRKENSLVPHVLMIVVAAFAAVAVLLSTPQV